MHLLPCSSGAGCCKALAVHQVVCWWEARCLPACVVGPLATCSSRLGSRRDRKCDFGGWDGQFLSCNSTFVFSYPNPVQHRFNIFLKVWSRSTWHTLLWHYLSPTNSHPLHLPPKQFNPYWPPGLILPSVSILHLCSMQWPKEKRTTGETHPVWVLAAQAPFLINFCSPSWTAQGRTLNIQELCGAAKPQLPSTSVRNLLHNEVGSLG